MFIRPMTGLLLLCARGLPGQATASTVNILERLAVQAAIERSIQSVDPKLRIVIDPMIVRANEAPGRGDSTVRDSARSAYLTQAFRARVLPRQDVIDCVARTCKLRDADVLVTLSEPAIAGSEAKVTVTTVQQGPRGIWYRTVNVRFTQRGAEWRVVGIDELGVS